MGFYYFFDKLHDELLYCQLVSRLVGLSMRAVDETRYQWSVISVSLSVQISQSDNQSASQSVCQSVTISVCQSDHRSISQSGYESASLTIGQLIMKLNSVNRSV